MSPIEQKEYALCIAAIDYYTARREELMAKQDKADVEHDGESPL